MGWTATRSTPCRHGGAYDRRTTGVRLRVTAESRRRGPPYHPSIGWYGPRGPTRVTARVTGFWPTSFFGLGARSLAVWIPDPVWQLVRPIPATLAQLPVSPQNHQPRELPPIARHVPPLRNDKPFEMGLSKIVPNPFQCAKTQVRHLLDHVAKQFPA